MARTLTLVGAVVCGLIALIIPAAASATPLLTNQTTGVAIPVNAQLMATSSNAVLEDTKLGTLTCTSFSLGAELTKNSGTAVEAGPGPVGTSTATGCGSVTIDEPSLVSLVTNNTTTDEGTLTLSFKVTKAPLTCAFSGTGSFTYKTGTGNDILTISKSAPINMKGPAACETTQGLPRFSGEFTLEIDTGGKGTGPFDPAFMG
jgi:hypothetical protein